MAKRMFQKLYTQWLKAVASGLPVTAKAHAETLLDAIKYIGPEHGPAWTSKERTFFFNWCEREGLIPPATPTKKTDKK